MYFQRSYLWITSHLGLQFQHMKLKGTQVSWKTLCNVSWATLLKIFKHILNLGSFAHNTSCYYFLRTIFKYVFIKLPFKIMESNHHHETTLFLFYPITLLYNYCLLFHSTPGYSMGNFNGCDILYKLVSSFFCLNIILSVFP